MALAIDEKRAILATLGRVTLPSDAEGRHICRMSDSIEARNHLKGRLAKAGCAIDESSDYPTAGKFNAAVEGLDYGFDEPKPAPAKPVASMSPEAIRMKLIVWLKEQASEHTEVAHGTPIEFTKIDAEAGIPGGTAEILIANAYGDRWTEVERSGGHVILELKPERVRDTQGGGGEPWD